MGDTADLGGQPPLAGSQDPAVRVGKAGEVERQQLGQGARGLIEPRLEIPGGRPQGRHGGRARGGRGPAGIAQQRLAGDGVVVRHAPGGQEGLGLARAQAVAQDGVGQARLLGAREGREGVGQGRRQPPLVDIGRDRGAEPAAQRQAPVDPAAAAAEEAGDRRGREVVVVGQRADHAGLVHRAQRATRGVGLEEARLAHHAGGILDDDGHVGVARAGPAGQALEAIEDLVAAVVGGGDAQGQRGERAGRIGARPAQGGQGGGQLRDGQDAHGRDGLDGHGRCAHRGSLRGDQLPLAVGRRQWNT